MMVVNVVTSRWGKSILELSLKILAFYWNTQVVRIYDCYREYEEKSIHKEFEK